MGCPWGRQGECAGSWWRGKNTAAGRCCQFSVSLCAYSPPCRGIDHCWDPPLLTLLSSLLCSDPDQVQQAVKQGLLPEPAAEVAPAQPEVYGQLSPFAAGAAAHACQPAEAQQADSMAPPAPLPLPRRASVTPRHAGQPALSPFSPFD